MGHTFKLIGAPCASRGPYTFYKAFKYTKNNITNILTINEFFFVKLWSDSDLISIGELRLLWEDQTSNRALASLRLYILPENTPDGRISDIHGEDEVLAITEKVVIRLDDLLTWITEASDWNWGLGTVWQQECDLELHDEKCASDEQKLCGGSSGVKDDCLFCDEKIHTLVDCSALDYSDMHKEKRQLDMTNWERRTGVIVLSYSRYCRYRGLLKRLEGVHNEWLRSKLIKALGGFTTTCRTTKILFCKDTFDYPELEGHELLCNHLAPKLRSRIPKKKKVLYPSPVVSEADSSSECATDDERLSSSASSSSASTNSHGSNAASRSSSYVQDKVHNQPSLPARVSPAPVKTVRSAPPDEEKKQKAFIQNLYSFMKARLTPIGRLPHIGNREINLYEFYNKVRRLGGHSSVTSNKLWKSLYEDLGGELNYSASSTLARKHYEKFLLPYEQHMAQQLKHANNRLPVKQQNDAINHKSQTTSANVTEFEARKKPVASPRPVQSPPKSVVAAAVHTKTGATNNALFGGKPGDKENIPLASATGPASAAASPAKKAAAAPTGRAEVIDLCDGDEERRSVASAAAAAKTKAASPVNAASSAGPTSAAKPAAAPEVIDLCSESSPIKRSVPSIVATLVPRKRKLDILKEGGLEVTPISMGAGGSARDVVTITRQPAAPEARVNHQNAHHHPDGLAAYMKHLQASVPEAEMTVELVEPAPSERPTSSDDEPEEVADGCCGNLGGASCRLRPAKSAPQVLDLRTIRNSAQDGSRLLKSIGPSLGPNIEISLVPSDNNGGTSGAHRADERRRRPTQLPAVPPLRKISTGELATKVNNGGSAAAPGLYAYDGAKGRHRAAGSAASVRNRADAYAAANAGPTETALMPAAFRAPLVADAKKLADISARVPDVEQYYSALYGSLVSAAAAAATDAAATGPGGYVGLTAPDASNGAHGLQLSPAELLYAQAAHMRPPRQELSKMELNDKTLAFFDTYQQKLQSILKNNTVSIIENYEKIVPD